MPRLGVTEDDFAKATAEGGDAKSDAQATQNPTQQPIAPVRTGPHDSADRPENKAFLLVGATGCETVQVDQLPRKDSNLQPAD